MKTYDFLKQNKGLTLIETLVVVALIAAVTSLGYTFFFTGTRAFDRNIERVDYQQNVRHSISFITRRLLNANADEVVVDNPSSLRIGTETFAFSNSTLRLQGQPFAEGISSFTVSRVGSTVNLTMSAGAADNPNRFSVSTQVRLRR